MQADKDSWAWIINSPVPLGFTKFYAVQPDRPQFGKTSEVPVDNPQTFIIIMPFKVNSVMWLISCYNIQPLTYYHNSAYLR